MGTRAVLRDGSGCVRGAAVRLAVEIAVHTDMNDFPFGWWLLCAIGFSLLAWWVVWKAMGWLFEATW